MRTSHSFFAELQRRHVYKVGASYAVAGWLLVQIATQVAPIFHVGEAWQRITVLLVIAGFPVALAMAWIFDVTPKGIVRTEQLPAEGEPPAIRKERRFADHRLNWLLGGLLILALAYLFAERTWLRRASWDSDGKSIAVLPFESLSDDKANTYFAEGIEDEILTRLSKIGALHVISRTSTENLGSNPGDLKAIAKSLGVDTVLEGSVQKAGDQVHINVQLISAMTGDHIWAETYDRKLDNVFGVEGEVAQAIAEALNAKLTGDEHREMTQSPTSSPEAYDAYLRGLADESHSGGIQDYFDAQRHFEDAVKLDPKFALAWAHLSIDKSYLYANGLRHAPQDLSELRETAEIALKLQPELGEAWLARGFYFYRGLNDFDAALTAFDEAGKRLPNLSEVNAAQAYVLRRQGRFDEAIAHLNAAIDGDPKNVSHLIGLATTYIAERKYQEADVVLDRAVAMTPGDAASEARVVRARMFQDQGDLDKAQTFLAGMRVDSNTIFALSRQLLFRHQFEGLKGLLLPFLKKPSLDLGDALPELYSMLGAAGYYAGDSELLKAAFGAGQESALALQQSGVDTAALECSLGLNEAGLGEAVAARDAGASCVQKAEGDLWQTSESRLTQLYIDSIIGDRAAVLQGLPQLLKAPNGLTRGDLQFNPVWDSLRKDPAFEKIVAAAQ